MVPDEGVDLRPVDKLILGYLGFVTLVILSRGSIVESGNAWLLGMHLLVGALIFLFTRIQPEHRAGTFLRDLYPLLLLLPLYGEIGVLSAQVGPDVVLAHDATVQRWEATLFGGQPSFDWIRRSPSVWWSAVSHLAYFAYYVIVVLGPLLLLVRGRRLAGRSVLFATMIAFIACYVVFVLYPVAGPYYAFPHPTGPVRDVWAARLVYGVLSLGSSFGAAFPSSHVAATVAATLGVLHYWRPLGWAFAGLAMLLTVGTVYCQMHYAIDATTGVLVGIGAWMAGRRV